MEYIGGYVHNIRMRKRINLTLGETALGEMKRLATEQDTSVSQLLERAWRKSKDMGL